MAAFKDIKNWLISFLISVLYVVLTYFGTIRATRKSVMKEKHKKNLKRAGKEGNHVTDITQNGFVESVGGGR